MATLGGGCDFTSRTQGIFTSRDNTWDTYVFEAEEFPIGGTITSICLYLDYGNRSRTGKVKILRPSGSQYLFVSSTSFSFSSSYAGEAVTVSGLSISVAAGDIIAITVERISDSITRAAGKYIPGTGVVRDIEQDVSGTTTISSWVINTSGYDPCAIITYTEAPGGDKYVDISTGSDSDSGNYWAAAYLTVKKGIDNVPVGQVLHIAEGDYSAQAAIDLNKNLELLCEDYGGGVASPPLTVILPVTT